jgi:hypothetical protein
VNNDHFTSFEGVTNFGGDGQHQNRTCALQPVKVASALRYWQRYYTNRRAL